MLNTQKVYFCKFSKLCLGKYQDKPSTTSKQNEKQGRATCNYYVYIFKQEEGWGE